MQSVLRLGDLKIMQIMKGTIKQFVYDVGSKNGPPHVCRPKPEAPAGRSPGPGVDSAAPKPPPTRDAAATAPEEASFRSYSNHVSEMDGGSKFWSWQPAGGHTGAVTEL